MKVEGDQTYYYKVCAVDEAGYRGAFSEETSVKTKKPFARNLK